MISNRDRRRAVLVGAGLIGLAMLPLTKARSNGDKCTRSPDRPKFDYVMGTGYYAPPEPPMPVKGVAYTDPSFHTTVTRITDKKADKYVGPGIQNEYAKSDPENSDGTLLVLRGNSAAWYLYDARTFRKLRQLKIFDSGGQEPEPRWDNANARLFYYVNNMTLRSYDTSKNKVTTVHDFAGAFPDGAYITTSTEGDASLDRRYWAFMVKDDSWNLLSVIVYDKVLDQIVGRKDSGFLDSVNWVGMDMSGNHCIVGYDELLFPQVFKRDFSKGIKLVDGSNGHADFARTAAGKDVLVYQNVRNDYIAMSDLDTGKETRLVKIPFKVNYDIGLHFSGNCALTPGWILVSTYGAKNLPPDVSKHSWMDTQLFMVELKSKPRIWRLAHTQAYTSLEYDGEKNYFAEAFAAINRAGTRVYVGSNWSNFAQEYSECYRVTLPAGWLDDMPK